MASPTAPASRLRLDGLVAEPTDLLRRLRHRRRLVALVGAWHHGEALIAFAPDLELGAHEDPFNVGARPPAPADGTFGGGWLGIWGYRLGRRLEEIGEEPRRPHPQPDHVLGHYRHVLRRVRGTWWAESLDGGAELAAWVDSLRPELDAVAAPQPGTFTPFRSEPGPAAHEAGVARVLEHIVAGDIFQANLCQRLEATYVGDPLDAFCDGVEALHPAYSAYVAWDDGAVVSLSPELFLRRAGSEVLASPIKGTAPLDADPEELAHSAKDRAENVMIVDLMRNDLGRVCEPGSVRVPAISRVEKHSVWHLVSDVVGHLRAGLTDADLLRATFPPGSVTGAPKVRAMQITDALEPTAREAYTGAIGHLSPHAGLELNVAIRTLEFASPSTRAQSARLRTNPSTRAQSARLRETEVRLPEPARRGTSPAVSKAGGQWAVWLGVGGGIVADSVPAREQAECLTKAAPILDAVGARLDGELRPTAVAQPEPSPQRTPATTPTHSGAVFETVLVVNGAAVDLDAHLARLDASVRALHGTTVRAGLEVAVGSKISGLAGRHRLRIDAAPLGPDAHDPATGRPVDVEVTLTVGPLREEAPEWELDVHVVPGGWGAHKWADREPLGPHVPGRDRLLVDTDGSVLETARGSLFVVQDDGVHTPPLDGRILPGTERARVIEDLRAAGIGVHQRRITTADLARASEVFVTNALRGVVPITRCPGVGEWEAGPVASGFRHGRRLRRGPAQPTEVPSVPQRRGFPLVEQRRGFLLVEQPRELCEPGVVETRVLFIDNYDSFVHNLAQYAGELGAQTVVVRNDGADVDDLVTGRERGEFTHLVISPGPGTPAEAGISAELIRRLGPTTPTLGVCLGHQVIGEVYGGRVIRADEVVHGKPSLVHHDGDGVFAGLPSPLTCGRYHSLVIDPDTLPPALEVTARTASGVIMGVRHFEHPVEGVQVHPESILTHRGHDMLATFLARRPN